MLIVLAFFVALLCGAIGGFLYHTQQPAHERDGLSLQDISWPRSRSVNDKPDEHERFYLGVIGDCLFGAVGGILLLALLNRLLGDYVSPIFDASAVALAPHSLFVAWLYLVATATFGGYLGLRLLRLTSGSGMAHWKRQLDQQRQDMQLLEAEVRESRSSLLVTEGIEKLKQGYLRQALTAFERALALTPGRARILGQLGYCKSLLAEEKNRVEGEEPVTIEQALRDLNEGIRLIEEQLDPEADPQAISPLYYNRARVQYLKWRGQGRSPARLKDDEIDQLKGDIQRALRQDVANRVWHGLLVDCGLAKMEAGGEHLATRDFRDLYEQSPAFKTFVLELKESRTPSLGIHHLQKAPAAFEMDEVSV